MLRLTRPMMHGPAVRRLQEMLHLEDVDGVYGPVTESRVRDFQFSKQLKPDGIVGPITWEALKADGNATTLDSAIVDRRGKHPRPRLYNRKRTWSTITGVTLHQTGCPMPSDPEKWDRLNAHYGVTQEGLIVWANDETDFIWHGNKLSASTIGIEIEGNFEGVEGDPRTLWRGGGPKAALTTAQRAAISVLFEHLKARFEAHKVNWIKIYGHRQSSATRVADPGSLIWTEVALPWAIDLKLTNHDGGFYFCVGSGRPIPKVWDDRRTERYR